MSCFENFIPKTEVEKDLVKTYSTNTRKRDKLLGILKSEEFREYYRAKEGKDLDENVDKDKVKTLLSNMFNSKYFSVEETSVIKTSKGRFTSFSARKLAKDESIRSMHVLYYKGATAKANDGKIHKFKNYAEFCKFIGKRWEQLALDRVLKICDIIAVDGVLPSNIQQILNSTDTSSLKSQRNSKIKELNATKDKAKAKNLKSEIIALDEEIDKLIYKRLDGILNRADASDSDRNVFAAYSETKMEFVDGKPVVNSNNAFFSDIKRNGSVKHIVNLSGKGDFTYDYEIDEEQNNNESADGDDFIAKANQHLGNFDSYAQHADSIIRSYLSSLVKLTDANNLESYDTDNELGIMMPMNVGQVMSVLYSRVDKSSPDNMISSIERIAKDDKEMRGLAKLAKDMKDDANLKAAIYSTFGKIVIPKAKISVDENGHTYAISNPRAMRKDALRMSCLNEIRSTVLNVDPEMLKHVIDKLKDSKDVNYITVELINACKHISPNLAKNAINLYINKDNDKLKNAKQLIFILQALVTNMPKIQASYYSIRNKQKELRDQNYKLKKDIREIEKFIAIHGWTKAADDEIKGLYSSIQYNNRVINSLYKEDYIKELIPNIYSLCDTLLDYTSVAVELNSINVEGNSSSDVINSSMITSIINRLQNVAARQAFGDSNARYSGFKFSNILIEKTKDGVLVNPGLFRIVDSDIEGNEIQPKVVPTEYCRDIINFALFDGVKNGFTNESALYERLSSDDYLISAFDAFNSRKEVKVNGRSILMANYFCRIPSDAPKQFLCEAPRLNTKGLIDRNGNINRNHPIFDNFRNIFHGEINDAVQSLGRIFKIDTERHAVAIEHGEPVFREGYSNNPEDARKAYDVFHVGINKDQSRFFYEKDEKGNCILAGNVFKSDRFILSGRNKNYADAIIGTKVVDGKAEGKINFLYGEGDNGLNLSVTTASDGKSIAHVNYSLNAEQEKAIDDMIESFIRDYISDSVARVSEINGFSKKPSTDDIIDFSINTYLMYNNFNELLEGDTKFYKDAQTFLKRAKEMQGSGVPYGITSFDSNYEPKLSNIPSSLDNSEIIINGKKVVMRDGFKAVTILNTIRTSEDSKRLFGTKSKNFEDSELVQNHIITKEVAANLSDLYSGTKINDAQSYITFEEWIRRITARGQLPKYKDLIGRILDESKELNVEDIQEFVQVQKNFYYDLHYDAEFDKFVPRQIKNAEFVLVPRFIKGTELEKVYDLMVKNNIDQLNTAETSKAGKKNVLSIFDENGLVSEKNIEDFNKNIKKCFEIYSYNNLYTQQEVAQHMDGSNKAGIQIMKKILDNIDPSSPIYKYKKQIIEAYCENIKESYVKLMEDLGIEIDENGAPKLEKDKNGEYIIEGLKLDKLYKMFYEEAQRTNADSNTLEFFTTDDDGNPILPPFLSNVSNKIESIIQSVFNNHVTRQLLSGFHAAQVTGVGMSSKIISQNELSSKSGSKTGNKLQFHPTIKGKIQPYAECLVQMPKEYHNKYIKLLAAGKTKSEAEAEILDLMQKSTADEFIAYRIPTEGKQSISVFKIVGFLDRGQGSTIVVADDWVSQTGSDFDVDSIYTITKSLTVEENGDISVKTDNNVNGRGNKIIDAMISILSDESSFEENLTPSNFKDIIRDRNEMIPESVKTDKEFRSPYNPYDQALYQNDVTSGMTLKGMSVSRDNLCSICNTVKPFISRPITCVYYASDGYTKENIEKYTRNYRSYPITDKDGKAIDTKFVVTHETFGWGIENRNIKGKILTSYSSQTTAHILDAVKEGNIPNVNQFTFGIYKMFPDLGTDYRTAISFMIQPAITNLINTYNNGNSVFNSEKYDYYNAKREMLKHYSNKLGLFGSNEIFNIKEFYKKFTSSKEIIDICTKFGIDIRVSEEDEITPIYQFDVNLQKERLNNEGMFKDEHIRDIYDVIILTQFDDLYYLSKKIGDYVRCSNPDRFGAKVSNYETLKTLNDIYKVSYSGILSKGGVDLLKLIYPDCDSYNKLTENSAPKQYEKLIDSLKLQKSKFNVKDVKSGEIEEVSLSDVPDEVIKEEGKSAVEETLSVMNNKKDVLNEADKNLAKNVLGTTRPNVMMASEHTDPVFHADRIIKQVNEELAKPIKERRFHMMQIMTKHDGLPLRKLLELKMPKSVHFSITSLGSTKYEPGVMKSDDLLDRIQVFIDEKLLNPSTTTIRIDPIIPGVTKKEDIEHIVERASKMGIKQFKFSILDSYGYTENAGDRDRYVVQKMRELGYEWEKYYNVINGKISQDAKIEILDEIYTFIDNLVDKYNVRFNTCGEKPVKLSHPLNNISFNTGCLNVNTINSVLKTSDVEHVEGQQRVGKCSCYGNKVDALRYGDSCASSCVYCYAKHNSDRSLEYYNPDGTLKNNNFTKTKEEDLFDFDYSEESDNQNLDNEENEFIVDNSENKTGENELNLSKMYATIDKSAYRPANYFLHYSTIISTLVEKSIFETEKYSFRQKINSLSETIGRPLTEDEYKDFKRWYIATKIFRNTNFSMDGIPEHGKNINQNDSLERISGLNKQIAFDFSCKDIMNPTDEEKAEFDKLTPGQKVIWIQQHSVSGGIFDKLNVNLGNILQTSSIATTHRITFNSDNFDIEDALGEMKQAWYSRNYFVKSTVFDLFKYAIVVENFSRKRFGITPLIVNDILIDTGFGENVITELRNDKFNELDAHNYIRSHWRNLKLKSSNRDFFKARDEGHGNCFAFIDNDSIHFAKEVFGVGEDKIIPNYVVISDPKIDNGEPKCYIKIPLLGNTFMLAPINELMPTENSEFSSKEAFNTSASLEYYAKYAAFLIKKQTEGKNFTKVFYEKVNEYKHKGEKLIEHPIFDVNEEAKNPTSGFNKLIDDIRKGKEVHGNYDFYVFNHALAEKLPSMIGFSAQNYTEQIIDGVTYFLKHENPKRIKVLGTNFEELCNDAIKECENIYGKNSSVAERKEFADKYLSQHYGNKAIFVSKELQELLRKSIEADTPLTNSIFYVMRKVEVDTTDDVDETSMQSSIGEISEETAAQSFVVAMRNDSRNGQEDAFRYLSEFDKEGINIKNDESVKSNVPDILEKTKRYLSKRAEDLIYDANHFYKDEDGNYHRLDDDETIEHIKNNTSEMHRWLRLYFDIKSFGNNYNYVRENGLDTNSENPKNKENLEQIDDIVRNILSQKFLKNAENKFTKLIISQSGDELIANEWFDLTSIGYHNIGGIENLWTDSQEAPIPLMQVILHMATSDVRAKELLMRKRIKEFTDKTDAILKDAMSAGFPINWDHIVDENGNLIRKYTPEFVETYEKFREELKEIANDKSKGQYSVEYLRKRHELDAFLIDNVEREYVRDYYVDLYNLEDTMLNDKTGYPLLYAKYKELSAKRVDILSHAGNGDLTDSQKDELDKIQDEIDTLTSTYGREYTFNILGQIMKSRNEWTQEEFEEINASVEAVQALNNYIKGIAVIKDKYFNNNEKEAFKELLEKNLKTIYDMEDPDINGNPRTPQSELQNNKIYKDAVNWVKYNARLVVNPEFKKLLDKAFKELNLVGKGTTGLISKYAKALHARDLTGAIDGRKFNVVNPNSSNGQTYAQEIKEDVVKNVGANATSAMDSKKLISNNPDEDNIIWKHEFWMALHSNGITNPEYIRITAEINNILIKGWDKVSKTIDMSYFSKQDFEKLAELYDKIRPDYYSKEAVESGQFVKKTINGTNGAGVADFIENNVDFVISPTQQAHYDAQRKKIIEMYGEHSETFEAWRNVNSFFYEKALPDGSITFVEKPNILLYGTIKPKDAEGSIEVDSNGVPINVSGNERFEYWVDKKKTIANATLRKFTRKVPTAYYWEARREAYTQKPDETEAEAKERYDKWLADNHYFNPSTHSVEPIPCWVSVQYKDSSANRAAVSGKSDLYSYEPRWNQMETEIKDEYSNNSDSYNKDLGLLGNYIPGNLRVGKQLTSDPVTKYDNNIKRTKYEDDMYSILNDTMQTLCVFDKAKRYIRNGALPAKAKERSHSKAWHIKQMATGLGYWYNLTVNHNDWQNNVGYDNDYQIDMPGLKQLVDNSKGGTVEKLHYPNKSDERFNKNGVFDKAAYDAEYNEIDKKNKDIEKHNQEIHNALLDRDWLTVMKEFMVEAGHYNAVQENKLLLYFGLDYLKNHEVYSKTLGKKKLKYDDKKSLGNTVKYEQEGYGEKTLAVYEAFCRRFIFNQFKKDQGNYTKFANLLQQWSSAKYMMLNVTGGIANVLYGETQIAMEAFANSYFSKKDWAVGKSLWIQSIPSFGANLYSDKASELGDGLCKLMNTLEFDKITELHEDNPSSKTKYQRVRNAAYCLQTIGEHFMQNGALLSILASHRIYKAPNGKWVATSEEKYVRNRRLEALKEILGDNYSNFENWIKSFKDDPNVVQDYATRRKDPITAYVKNYLTSEQQNSFIDKQKELETQAREEFKKFPTVYDQFELVNGYAEFKPDSLLADRDKMTEEEAYNILGCIKNKTISVNKKIHGVYDKLGASRLEQEWYGGLIMQYHKHIWPGIMKRWRREGYYNEDRETVEKGSYVSLWDFLSIPYSDMKNMPESSKNVMTGIQNYFKAAARFLFNIKTNYKLLPDYEKANIRRCLSEIAMYLSAVCVAIALKMMDDDDEYEESISYNLMVYLADRLSTEIEMYTPRGAIGEGKKLWSQPIAVEGIVLDLLNAMGYTAQMLIQGDEYSPNYKSGPYYGDSKITTLLTRQLPIYRSTSQIWRLPKNNKYYKRQTTLASDMSDIIVKQIKD